MRKTGFGTTASTGHYGEFVPTDMFMTATAASVFAPAEIEEGCEGATDGEGFVTVLKP